MCRSWLFKDKAGFSAAIEVSISESTSEVNMITIYHNPRCTKSRESLALLEESGKEFDIKLYLKDGLSPDELEELKSVLSLSVIEWTRTKEKEFKELGLNKNSSDSQLIEAMIKCPKLLERPILVSEGKAVVGRPKEKTAEFLKSIS